MSLKVEKGVREESVRSMEWSLETPPPLLTVRVISFCCVDV